MAKVLVSIILTLGLLPFSLAGEKIIVSLKDFREVELKSAGIELPARVSVRIKARGGGGEEGWTSRRGSMYAYGWIINADTRKLVWKMEVDNTDRSRDDREFDARFTLERGSYEIYYAAYAFGHHTFLSNFHLNIDHRDKPLFHSRRGEDGNFFKFFKDWWSEDLAEEWERRSKDWGIEILVDEGSVTRIKTFTPPKQIPNIVLAAVSLGENEVMLRRFSLDESTRLDIYAIGEGRRDDELVDYGWIIDADNRERVWEMGWRNVRPAGGAKKNVQFRGDVTLPPGNYVLYYITDDSHSKADWNEAPPNDPLNWGITISVAGEKEKKAFKTAEAGRLQNVIVSLVKTKDDESRTEGFTLKEDSRIRIYAVGERSNSRREMVDYGFILNAKTRSKVWMMDVDRSYHAGGSQKNRYVDEIISLPRGSYLVTYRTDDSHAYDDWNADPPFDPEHYGITVMGAGEKFKMSVVEKYAEMREKNVIAQIIRVGDDEHREQRFKLDKTTRVRIYAIGEGINREVYDFGWIEDVQSGNTLWEMTYGMTFHAGGHRKNRMVNTTIVLDRGEYKLHYKSDDSHSYDDWNSDPPEDAEYWGITLYRDDGSNPPGVPPPPPTPEE